MAEPDVQDRITAACNTGPLLSAFQCAGVIWIKQYIAHIYVAPNQATEFAQHGASAEFQALVDEGFVSIAPALSAHEMQYANTLAKQIADRSSAAHLTPEDHLPEAEMLVIAQRPTLGCKIVLLDEKTARAVAGELGLRVTGFPGILARAGLDGWLTRQDIQRMLKQCQRLGTRYSNTLIDAVAKNYGR